MSEQKTDIPRIIWVFWHQGMARAPFVVRNCVSSWVRANPGWEVVLLDKDNLSEYMTWDLPPEKLAEFTLNMRSNLLRVQLLSEHGGVWADATTFCVTPLDEWLGECTDSGFFAFHRPGPDRLLSTWFMASEKGGPIVQQMRKRYVAFFTHNRFGKLGPFRHWIARKLGRAWNRNTETTRNWLSPLATKLLRVYPYFLFHYLFERLVAEDPECRRIWSETRKISADGPHKVQATGLCSLLNARIKDEIDARRIPVYKLTWKYDHSQYTPASVLGYLCEERRFEQAPAARHAST